MQILSVAQIDNWLNRPLKKIKRLFQFDALKLTKVDERLFMLLFFKFFQVLKIIHWWNYWKKRLKIIKFEGRLPRMRF